jgi:hypothetical protein
MSITSPIPNDQGIAHTAIGVLCFVCGDAVASDPAIHWLGTTDIYIHPQCFPGWMAALTRDYHEILNPDYYVRRLKRSA